MSGDNRDFADMKKLLTLWHVEILYNLFKEEDISIEELKIMQISHINHLMKSFKMGVRIRFEHHLKNWRNRIGLPLNTGEEGSMCCCQHRTAIENGDCINRSDPRTKDPGTKRNNNVLELTTENIDFKDSPPPPMSPQSVKSENSLINMFSNTEMPHLTPITILGSTPPEEEADTLNTLTDFLSASLDNTPPKFPSKSTPDKCPVSLAQILKSTGARGVSLIQHYNKTKRFTNAHRTQLIQTIVEFFDDNDIHLSLNMSHNLEWEILKMFPTEKLEYYRTEKRGKIYVKFSNMKRYKRERGGRVKPETELPIFRSRRLRENHNNDIDINDE